MNRHSANPWARLRVLLMLPAVALSVIFASACKQDATEIQDQNVEDKTQISAPVEYDIIEVEPEEMPDDVFVVVDEMPEFPGGTMALLQFLASNIKYPAECKEKGIQGRVLVSFTVNKDGSIIDPEVVKSVDPALDAVALKVVNAMPTWKPGKQKGETVRVRYTVPLNFRLDREEKEAE